MLRRMPQRAQTGFTLLLAMMTAAVAWGQSADDPPSVSTLGNGLKVMAIQLPGSQVATLQLIVKGGTLGEPQAQTGWLHLLEHMLWKGHEGYPRQADFLAHSNRLGVWRQSEVTEGWMSVTLTAPTDSLQAALRHLLEIVRTTTINQAQLDLEKRVILQELDRLSANPDAVLDKTILALLAAQGVPDQESRDALFNATAEKMRLLRLRNLLPNNSGLVVAGSLPRDQLLDVVRLIMGPWPDGFVGEVTTPSSADRYEIYGRDSIIVMAVKHPRWVLAWPGPPIADIEATQAARLLTESLVGLNSPFFQRLYDEGIVLDFSAEYRMRPGGGALLLKFTLPRERLANTQALILQEIRRLADPSYLGPAVLRNARNELANQMLLLRHHPGNFVRQLGSAWAASDLAGRGETAFPPSESGQQELFEFLQTYITGIAPYHVLMLDAALRRTLPTSQPAQR